MQERKRLQQLQCDFEYNLSLLEQRDAELGRYDTTFSEVRSTVSGLVTENSELKVGFEVALQHQTVGLASWCMCMYIYVNYLHSHCHSYCIEQYPTANMRLPASGAVGHPPRGAGEGEASTAEPEGTLYH